MRRVWNSLTVRRNESYAGDSYVVFPILFDANPRTPSWEHGRCNHISRLCLVVDSFYCPSGVSEERMMLRFLVFL